MTYFETELLFTSIDPALKTIAKGSGNLRNKQGPGKTDILGVTIRLGNQPIIYNLKDLGIRGGKPGLPSGQDHYLIVHVISVLRIHGTAKVDELQYHANAIQPIGLQTIDLIPKTRFNEIVRAGINLDGCLDLFGEVSLDVPSSLMDSLINQFVQLGVGMQLQLTASPRSIGRFLYSLQIPVTQASGIGSNSCAWILKPDENKTPLLGDQLLIQSIAVPRGTKKLVYKVSGLVKADRGILWKQQEQATPEQTIEINLNPTT